MKKISKTVILMIITIFLMTINVFGAEFGIGVKMDKQENDYTITISLKELMGTGIGINAFVCDLEYDREVFEIVKQEDITTQNGWGDLTFNEKNGSMVTLRNDFTKQTGEEILEIKLTQKADSKSGSTEIKITNIQASDSQNDLEADDKVIKFEVDGQSSLLKTILIVVLATIAVLLVIRIFVRTQAKRRKRR